jgi:hypothetical protein
MKYTPLQNKNRQPLIIVIFFGIVLLSQGFLRPAHYVIFGFVRQDYIAYGGGLSAIIFIIAVIVRFRVIITDEMLIVRGFIFSHRIRWVDIKDVKPIYQGQKYKFITLNGTVSISFRWFPKECYDEVFKRIPVQTT